MSKKTTDLFDTYQGPSISDKYALLHFRCCSSCSRHHVILVRRDQPVVLRAVPKDVVFEGIDPIVQRERGLI